MEHDSPSFLTLITKLQGHSAFGLCFRRIPGFRQILRGPVSRPVFAPPPPPPPQNKQTNKTYVVVYFILFFFLSTNTNYCCVCYSSKGLVTKLYSLTLQCYGIRFLSAYFITTAVTSSQFKVSCTTWGLFVVFAFKIKVSIIFKMIPWNY